MVRFLKGAPRIWRAPAGVGQVSAIAAALCAAEENIVRCSIGLSVVI
jgi:hypothetical protein